MRLRAANVTRGLERLVERAFRCAIVLSFVCFVVLSAACVHRNATIVAGRFFLDVRCSEGKIWLFGAALRQDDDYWDYALPAKIAEDFNSRLWNTSSPDDDWHGFHVHGSNEPLQLRPRSTGSTYYTIDDMKFPARWAFATLPTWFCLGVTGLLPVAYAAGSALRRGRSHVRRKRGLCV